MWVFAGLKFVLLAAFSPLGTAVVLGGLIVSCLCRVFLRDDLLKTFYMVVSLGILIYLLVIVAAIGTNLSGSAGSSTQSGKDLFVPMLFAMFFGIPFSMGWLFGWPVALVLQPPTREPDDQPHLQADDVKE